MEKLENGVTELSVHEKKSAPPTTKNPIKTIEGLDQPWGIALNQRGELLATEMEGHCVSVFTPSGEKLKTFGEEGSEDGEFNFPCGTAVTDTGDILVVDKVNHRIQRFSGDGKFIQAVGEVEGAPLDFMCPVGIAIHPQNKKVYIADQSHHRIQILNPDLTFHDNFGSQGNTDGLFESPMDVAIDATGNVYVADTYNNCVQVFTSEGKFLRKIGHSRGQGQLGAPSGVCIDSQDRLYVSEAYGNCVSVFTTDGQLVSSFGSEGSGPGQFQKPRGITVDQSGVIYVCDSLNNRLVLFH